MVTGIALLVLALAAFFLIRKISLDAAHRRNRARQSERRAAEREIWDEMIAKQDRERDGTPPPPLN